MVIGFPNAFWSVLFVIALVGDLVLSGLWVKVYFTRGLPIFRRSFDADPPHRQPPPINELQPALKSNVIHSLAMHALSQYEYAFRPTLIQLRVFDYTPTMHGLLRFDLNQRKVVVIGHANWLLILLTAMSVFIFISSSELWVWAFFGGGYTLIVGSLYLMDWRRYMRIGELAARRWTARRFGLPTDA